MSSTTLSSDEFVEQLKKEIATFHKLRINHPFVKAVCEGTASMDHIRTWAIQDYQFRAAVPRIALLRYVACSDPEFAPKLFEVAEEETRGLLPGATGHPDMFVEFAEAIGLTRADLENPQLLPATAAHLYFAELVIHTHPWFVVMAAQIGAEGTFGPAAALLGKGFMESYGMSPESVLFFTVHVEADEEHGSLAEEIARRYLTTANLQQQTREMMFRRMELLYDIWTI